jgi:DNA-binding transcriptional ArsR family regulator
VSFDSPRPVRSASELRAFSHPLRLRLMEVLDAEGPLTATEAAGRVGTTPSNASFHLRLLARHGFVEEASAGSGRRRPWRRVERPIAVDSDELDDESRLELRALLEVMLARHRENVLRWARERGSYPREWRDAAGETYTVAHLTADELAELDASLRAVLSTVTDKPVRPGTLPVAITLSTLPTQAEPRQQEKQ